MKKNINKNKDCAICYQIPMSLSPEGWRHLEEWHDNGHPNNEVNVTTTCNLDEKKCEHLHVTNWICDKCGVDTLRERRSEVLSPSDKTWEETMKTIGKISNIHPEIVDEFILITNQELTSATIKAKEEERESLKKAVEKLDTFCRHKNTLYPEGSERFNMDDMVLLADIEATLEESSK